MAGSVLTHLLKSEKSEASKQVQIFKKPLRYNVNAFVHVNEMNFWPAANQWKPQVTLMCFLV